MTQAIGRRHHTSGVRTERTREIESCLCGVERRLRHRLAVGPRLRRGSISFISYRRRRTAAFRGPLDELVTSHQSLGATVADPTVYLGEGPEGDRSAGDKVGRTSRVESA